MRVLALTAFLPLLLIAAPASAATKEQKMETCKVGADADNLEGKARGVSEKEYMSGNLLGREVTADDVAQAFLAQALALKTTADVTTVDGGNIAAALR